MIQYARGRYPGQGSVPGSPKLVRFGLKCCADWTINSAVIWNIGAELLRYSKRTRTEETKGHRGKRGSSVFSMFRGRPRETMPCSSADEEAGKRYSRLDIQRSKMRRLNQQGYRALVQPCKRRLRSLKRSYCRLRDRPPGLGGALDRSRGREREGSFAFCWCSRQG